MGFYPNTTSITPNTAYFELETACFHAQKPVGFAIHGNTLEHFKIFRQIFDNIHITYQITQKHQLLEAILNTIRSICSALKHLNPSRYCNNYLLKKWLVLCCCLYWGSSVLPAASITVPVEELLEGVTLSSRQKKKCVVQ